MVVVAVVGVVEVRGLVKLTVKVTDCHHTCWIRNREHPVHSSEGKEAHHSNHHRVGSECDQVVDEFHRWLVGVGLHPL